MHCVTVVCMMYAVCLAEITNELRCNVFSILMKMDSISAHHSSFAMKSLLLYVKERNFFLPLFYCFIQYCLEC